jgi:hypothetical protein
LSGPEHAGSIAGRQHVLAAIDTLGLQVPTSALPHRMDGLLSIDHIAVGVDQKVISATRFSAHSLCDDDGYVVEFL